MAEAALFIGWERAVPGHETEALELFASSLAYYGKLQTEGKITSFEPIVLSPHGGDLGGFFLLKGEPAKLDAVKRTDEFLNLLIRAGVVLSGVGVIDAFVGDSLQRTMTIYQNVLPRK